MNKILKSYLFRAPLLIIFVVSAFASIYIKLKDILPIKNATIVTLFVILAAYAYGEYVLLKKDKPVNL